MGKLDAGAGEMMAKMSQESHLPSPEVSAAGSDNGHVDDLKGESFSDLVEVEAENHHQLAKEAGAAAAAAATPSHRQQQQASLKTPAASSPANPGTCSNTSTTTSTTTSKSKSKSKSDPSQTTRKQGKSKSNTAKMMSTKATLSTSRRPTPINIQIVRVDSSSPQSSQSTSTSHKTNGPAHSFAMNMLPMTKIRELCLHASAHARRHLDLVLDGSRFEARDRDGHVFRGNETISEEILKGETIYLIEAGLDARGPARAGRGSSSSRAGSERPKGGGGARERGRLLCLKSLELEGEERENRAPYRTPSVSSRASSSHEASKGKPEPRLTPSQKALAIAQMGRTPATQEPVIKKRRPASSAVKKTLPSPVLGKAGEGSDAEAPGDETLVGEPDEGDDLERTLVAASPLRISTPPPSSPKQQHNHHHHEVPPNLQDSQLVIPDSQDPFSQGLFSQEPVESQQPAPTPSLPDMPDAPRAQPRPSPRVKAAPTTATTQARQPTSRPDPYDINTVLTDDEDERSDESNNTHTNVRMAPSVRKLGSATTQRKTVAPPPVSLPSPRRAQSNPPSPSRANRAGVPAGGSKTSTPAKKATPVKVGHSSPAVPLPSSPTTHVAAAIAKGGQRPVGRNRTPQLPSPGQIVLRVPSDSDEDDDLIEEAFRDLSRSYPPPSLPWSQPPLRVAPDAEAGGDDQPARRRGSVGSAAGEARGGTLVAAALPSASGSPRKSPLKKPLPPSPSKQLSHRSPIKSSPIITSPSKREEATIVHDSSSAVESDEDQDFRIVKKEIRNEESPSRKTRLADIPAIDKKPQQEEKKQHEVIELSSGSDSDIEPLEDILEEEEEEEDELKLPTIDVELPVQEAKVPPLSLSPARIGRSPLRDSPKTDPIKIEPAYEEPPPSAQASKRKRDTSEEPDPEDEKHRRKRVKREARKARRARDRGQKASMLLQEDREEQLAALQEERKKLALEKAHRRALELEIIVSSPVKREPSIELSSEEGDDENDSGLGSSANGNETSADVNGAGVPMDADDKNDSLSSKEAGDNRLSWRKLSKLHLSSPRKSSQDGPGEDSLDHLGVPPTSTPAIIEAQLQQCIEERFHRMPFDDWAFLENTLGHGPSGGYGHSALEVHHRVHLDMMHRAQHLPPHHTSATEEPTSASDEPQDEPRTPSGPTDRAGGDDAPARAQSQRSDAPSPKEQGARPQDKTKPVPKLRQERDRKRERRRRANGPYHHNFRNSHVGSWKMKQRQGRNGH